MLGWKAKIRAILPPNHDLPSQTKLFMKKLDETLKQMTSVDPLIHLLPLENNTDDIPAGKIVKLLSGNQAAYIKIKEVPKKKYMDAFLHFKSQSNYSKIKLQILPWFLQEKRIYIDEYKLERHRRIQIGKFGWRPSWLAIWQKQFCGLREWHQEVASRGSIGIRY